jgi:ClpA/ClpB-like protein
VRENEGVAARVLLGLDADAEKIRNEIIRMLSGHEAVQAARMLSEHEAVRAAPVVVSRARWEYNVLHVEEIVEKDLNELGADGWELFAIAGQPGDFRLVLRRVG